MKNKLLKGLRIKQNISMMFAYSAHDPSNGFPDFSARIFKHIK